MRTQWFRRLAGVAGLFAMAWLAAGPSVTAADVDTSGTSPNVIEADIAYLQKALEKTPEKRAVPTLRAAAMNLALAGSGDLRDQALKVADAVAKKDYAGAKAAAAKLTPGSGGGKAGRSSSSGRGGRTGNESALPPVRTVSVNGSGAGQAIGQ